jgi:hypothetical protein
MAKFYDATGALQDVTIDMATIAAASAAGVSLRDHVNSQYGTDNSRYGEVFAQMCAGEGIVFNPNKAHGIRAPKLDAIFNPVSMQAGVVTGNSNPSNQARVLLMPAILALVEDKLLANLEMNPAAFEAMVAVDDTITGDWVIWPEANYSKPEAARSQRVAQLAPPPTMLTLTTSEKSLRIPTYSLGVEWSEQATKVMGLDYIALSIARQAAIEKNERADQNLLAMLNGDADVGQAALAAPKVVKANALDATIVAAGVLTQTAWMKFLYRNSKKRSITHVITDINGALALEARTGKPVVVGDNPTSTRIDTLPLVMNPGWGPTVQVFVTDDANWPANTIMAIDANYAIHRVTSTTATYEAQEEFVLRRASAMRFDQGSVVRRLFDDAFEVLSLTL